MAPSKFHQFSILKECFNWYLGYALLIFGLMGAARGLDEGLIGTSITLTPFIERYQLDSAHHDASSLANTKSNITSMLQMGSILGAIVAFYMTDKLGRLWATRQLCFFWIAGISIFMGSAKSGNMGMLYAGRFIAGVGVGQTTVVAPTYLAEVAPKDIRGLCVTIFSGFVYIGIMLAYFASWGASIHISDSTQAQWLVPNSMHLMFASIILIGSFFARESPRWLVKKERLNEARTNLAAFRGKSYDDESIEAEMADICLTVNEEVESRAGGGVWTLMKELVSTSDNRYRVMLSVMTQFLGQWSGANSITIYAPEYFAMMGIGGHEEKLFATAILGVVKFVSAMSCAFFLIDFIGRRRSLMSGITLQLLSMTYMALFLSIDKKASQEGSDQSASQKRAAMGAIVMIYLSGFGWALGWNSIQYLINSEIYALRHRAIGGSLAMTVHFVNQYANSKAVPTMFLEMTEWGTMWFFAAVTAAGLAWVWLFIPELAGLPLENIPVVFQLPWYRIGRDGQKFALERIQEVEASDNEKKPRVQQVEVA